MFCSLGHFLPVSSPANVFAIFYMPGFGAWGVFIVQIIKSLLRYAAKSRENVSKIFCICAHCNSMYTYLYYHYIHTELDIHEPD